MTSLMNVVCCTRQLEIRGWKARNLALETHVESFVTCINKFVHTLLLKLNCFSQVSEKLVFKNFFFFFLPLADIIATLLSVSHFENIFLLAWENIHFSNPVFKNWMFLFIFYLYSAQLFEDGKFALSHVHLPHSVIAASIMNYTVMWSILTVHGLQRQRDSHSVCIFTLLSLHYTSIS